MSDLAYIIDPAVIVTTGHIFLAVLLGIVVVLLLTMARELKNRFTDQ